MYKITAYTKEKAKKLGFTVKPSKKKGKKIDVYSDKGLLASIGAQGYKDYPTYIEEKGQAYADERRKLYKKRHHNNKQLAGWLADKLLW